MSIFYCDYHEDLEDSDLVGFNEVESDDGNVVYFYCDEGLSESDDVEDALLKEFLLNLTPQERKEIDEFLGSD